MNGHGSLQGLLFRMSKKKREKKNAKIGRPTRNTIRKMRRISMTLILGPP